MFVGYKHSYMQTLTKEQIEPVMGKTSFWFPDAKKQLLQKVNYLGGIPEFEMSGINLPLLVQAKPNGLLLEKAYALKMLRVALLNNEIQTWAIEAQEQIFEQKDKSVVGRALIGGLLLGPVGAIVGGMSGIGTTAVRSSATPENILSITHNDGVILFSVTDKNRLEVERFMTSNYLR